MNFYQIFLWIHILSAFLLLFPLIFMPKLFHLYESEQGRLFLHRMHIIIGLGGWTLLVFGIAMLYLQNGAMLLTLWMQFSLLLFVLIQAIDHFWADKQEEILERGIDTDTSKLKWWTIAKLLGCVLIAVLMLMQPI